MSPNKPPKFLLRFFKWFCHPDLHLFIEGDLLELYQERTEELGKKKANRKFAKDVLLLFRPSIVRPIKILDTLLNHHAMLKNHFKIGFRNLNKHRFFSAINITGMTIGMTCFILIGLYIQYETSYDRQHDKANRIYRVAQYQEGNMVGSSDRFAGASLLQASTLKEEFPEIEAATTLTTEDILFSHEEEHFYEKGLFADEQLFDVFTYPLIEGQGVEALSDPSTIILTESMARKYFGRQSPIGKTLLFEDDHPLTVRGVLEDLPKNQHFSFDFLTSVKNAPWYEEDIGRWNHNNYYSYIVLPHGHDYHAFEKRLGIMDKYFEAAYASFSFIPSLFLQPLTDIHLHSDINSEIGVNGDIRYIYFSAFIALIILLLAAINYMNLATARSGQRAKEVGMRKVLGARKDQLIGQFMAESFLITLSSFAIGIGLAYLLLPVFNQILDQEILFNLGSNQMILVGIISTAILLAIGAGFYPGLLSSDISPIKALSGHLFKSRKDGAFLRNALVVGQFAAAIILASCSVVIYQQLQFVQDKKLGYSRDQILYVPFRDPTVFAKKTTVENQLLSHPQIKKLSVSNNVPLNFSSNTLVDDWEGNPDQKEITVYRNRVDYEFIDLFEIELVEGRNFSAEFPTDSTDRFILNETAVKALGWESAVGKSFKHGEVIGVVKDFHFQPLDVPIKPLFMSFHNPRYDRYGTIALKVELENTEETIAYVEQTLKQIMPDFIFDHRFMDESYAQLYKAEKRFGSVFNIFTFIALFIACMGLFGLVTHKVIQRTKEIGIRKVLGASIGNIVGLISKDFIRLVLISAFVAIPLAWFAMHKWLQDFAYRIELDWWVFAVVGLLAIGLASLTVSAQAVRAAISNPVKALKSE